MRTFALLLSITIGWDMDRPADGYEIHYITGQAIRVGYANTQRFTIDETVSGRTYKVYVVATNLSGVKSPNSRIITVTNK